MKLNIIGWLDQWRGNYFRTGGRQDRERQSREREIMFFAGNGVFLFPKQAFSKKKKSSP